MIMKSLVSAGLGVCALGLVATTAQAAPAAGLTDAIDRDAARSGLVESVTWYGRRHCHWDYGYRYCWYGHRYYRPYYRGYGYGHRYYGYGHRRWWY
jgi:hypothetical protein